MNADREDKALEALIALAMLYGLDHPVTEEDLSEDHLPELSAELKRISREAGTNIIQLLNKRMAEHAACAAEAARDTAQDR